MSLTPEALGPRGRVTVTLNPVGAGRWALLLLLVIGLLGVPAHAAFAAAKAKHVPLRELRKAQVRRELMRQVKRNPGVIAQRAFIKKASLVDFDLPLTMRLNPTAQAGAQTCANIGANPGCVLPITDPAMNGYGISDDVEAVTLTTRDITTIPSSQTNGAEQQVTVAGNIALRAMFQSDSGGYPTLGNVEIGLANDPNAISLAGAAPSALDLVDTLAPPLGCESDTSIVDSGPVTIGRSAYQTAAPVGAFNIFTGDFSMDLRSRWDYRARIRTDCTSAWTWTSKVTNTIGEARPQPLRFQGTFRISPAFTADRKIRLGVITFTRNTPGALATTGFLNFCTQSSGVASGSLPTPPAAPATPPPDTPTCDAGAVQSIPAAFEPVAFSAEVIIGAA